MMFSIEKGSKPAFFIATILFVIAILGMIFLIWYGWCSSQPKLPLYPHAKEVTVSDPDIVGNSTGEITATVYTLSFLSNDSPEQIRAFYRTALAERGWELERVDKYGGLVYHQQAEGGSGLLGLTISIGSGEQPKPFHVALTMGDYAEMDRVHALGR